MGFQDLLKRQPATRYLDMDNEASSGSSSFLFKPFGERIRDHEALSDSKQVPSSLLAP